MTGPGAASSPRRGERAEQAALAYLQAQGYQPVETNVRVPGGELDIVATDGDTLVFVEVRARKSGRYGTAQESLGPVKRRRVYRAVETYLQRHAVSPTQLVRIDVVAIELAPDGRPIAFDLIKDAFGEW